MSNRTAVNSKISCETLGHMQFVSILMLLTPEVQQNLLSAVCKRGVQQELTIFGNTIYQRSSQ